jgi:hypothetical protein
MRQQKLIHGVIHGVSLEQHGRKFTGRLAEQASG